MYRKCPLCDKMIGELTPGHASVHGMTKMQFITRYPQFMGSQFKFGKKISVPEYERINPVDKWNRRRG